MAAAIARVPAPLRRLSLAGNALGRDGARALGYALLQNPLLDLEVRENWVVPWLLRHQLSLVLNHYITSTSRAPHMQVGARAGECDAISAACAARYSNPFFSPLRSSLREAELRRDAAEDEVLTLQGRLKALERECERYKRICGGGGGGPAQK